MGTYTQIPGGGVGGITVNDWSGFFLCISQAGTNTARYCAKVSIDGGSTDFHPPIFTMPGSTGGWQMNWIPMQVPAGSDFRVAIQSTQSGSSLSFLVFGLIDQGTSEPGYTIAENVAACDLSGTRAGTTSISIVTNNTSFTQVNAGLAQTYGAFLLCLDPTAAFGTAQFLLARVGHGAGNTVLAPPRPFYASAATVALPRFTETLETEVASGETISVNVQGGTAADAVYANIIGYR